MIKIIYSQISREKGPHLSLNFKDKEKVLEKDFRMYELLGQLLRSGGRDQGSSFCCGKGRRREMLLGRWRWAGGFQQQVFTKGTMPGKTFMEGNHSIRLTQVVTARYFY